MAAAAGVARYALAIVIAALLPLPLLSEKFTGDGTAYSGAYEKDKTGFNACQYGKLLPYFEVYYGAMNTAQYPGSCGRCVVVRGIEAGSTGKEVLVRIVDECASCSYGDVDLSMRALWDSTGFSWDRKRIEWEYVECEGSTWHRFNSSRAVTAQAGRQPLPRRALPKQPQQQALPRQRPAAGGGQAAQQPQRARFPSPQPDPPAREAAPLPASPSPLPTPAPAGPRCRPGWAERDPLAPPVPFFSDKVLAWWLAENGTDWEPCDAWKARPTGACARAEEEGPTPGTAGRSWELDFDAVCVAEPALTGALSALVFIPKGGDEMEIEDITQTVATAATTNES